MVWSGGFGSLATTRAKRSPNADQADVACAVRAAFGCEPGRCEPLPAGLGPRRFYRVTLPDAGPDGVERPRTLVARVEDPDRATTGRALGKDGPRLPPEPPLEPIRALLESRGLPVPRSYAERPDLGIDLLEDVGDRTLRDATGGEAEALYARACALIPRLQAIRPERDGRGRSIAAFDRRYDRNLVDSKAWKWLEWTIPLLLGRPATTAERTATQQLFTRLGDLVLEGEMRLSHRDFKAENLHWQPAPDPPATGENRLVMIDVQGALQAPVEYDLVCLLYDLQVELPDALREQCLSATLPRLAGAAAPALQRRRADALALMRLCKDIAHVTYAARVRGDGRRWSEIPRGLGSILAISGRLEHTFPEIRALTSVTHTLTRALGSSDSAEQGREPRQAAHSEQGQEPRHGR